MSDGLLEKLVQEDFGLEGRGKWYHSSDHDSLVVNSEEQLWFWNSKNLRGGVLDYLIQVRGMKKSQAQEFLNNSFVAFKENSENSTPCSPYEKLVELMWANGLNNREYWYKRCLTDETIDRRKLGFYDGWSLIPLYEDNEFVNFQMRQEIPDKKITKWYRHTKPILYNDFILKYAKKIFITEGTVDSILLSQHGLASVSPNGTNTWQDSWFSKFNHIKEIYYVEDNDQAGRHGAKLVANSLGLYRVKIVSFLDKPEKYDTVDFFRDGGTKESFEEYVNSNSRFLFELETVYGRKSEIGKFRKDVAWAR